MVKAILYFLVATGLFWLVLILRGYHWLLGSKAGASILLPLLLLLVS